MALWDIRGKAFGVPVYRLLGGPTRDKVECYATGYPDKGGFEKTARACIDDGFRAYRFSVIAPANGPFNSREVVVRTHEQCQQIRAGVGKYGDWAIDFHTKLDTPDAVDLCNMIQDLRPLFVEDLVRSENPKVYRTLRQQVKVPIAVGEQFGDRWDINELIEDHLINYSRVTMPNVGGITEFLKLAAIAETHYVGLIPHFTGPISEAALVHCLNAFSGPAFMERQIDRPKNETYVPQSADFRNGAFWPNDRPGLGVEFDPKAAKMVADITEYAGPLRLLKRPDGSYTNW
jgi:L-alanine-DL-glutamate epimerase-like enolase superfamily enzyme